MRYYPNGRKLTFAGAFLGIVLTGMAWGVSSGVPSFSPITLEEVSQGAATEGVPAPSGQQWYRFANHTHTTYSDGSATLQQRLDGAATEGADAIVITDHNNNGACSDPLFLPVGGCLPICGEEFAWGAFDGELGLINISSGASIGGATVEAVIQSAHDAGGTVVVNHPFLGTEHWQYTGPDGDLHQGISGIEVWSTLFPALGGSEEALLWWDGFLARGRMVFGIGGSDMHTNTLKTLWPCNYVLASSLTALTAETLQAGLEAGHITISTTPTGPRCFVWCDAGSDGIYESPMGSNIVTSGMMPIRFRVEVYDGEGLSLQVMTKQGIVQTFTVGAGAPWYVDFTASAAGVKDYVRAEVRTENTATPIGACANPIYVNYTPGDSDSDGLSDLQEAVYGTNHYSADSDGDGLSDGFEVAYDGNAGAYDPFDAMGNPAGHDLNALRADTDGDGISDATELWLGINPQDPSDAALMPLNVTPGTGLLLLVLGAFAMRRHAPCTVRRARRT